MQEIRKKTHSRISIENITFRPFNRLQLESVYAADLQGDTLLYVGKLSAGFDLFKLWNRHLLVRSVALEDFFIHVQQDSPDADFNFQFLIDAFASGKTDSLATPSRMTIQIQDIRLSKGRIRYDRNSEPVLPDSLLDFNHIHLSDFRSDMNLDFTGTGNWNIRIKQFAFIEKSGLDIRQLQTQLIFTGKTLQLENGQLQLPHSQLLIPEADYTLPSTPNAQQGILGVKMQASIHPPDLKTLYPTLSDWQDPLIVSAEIGGALPQIRIDRLQADYGKHIHLNMQASIDDYSRWQNAPLQLEISRLSADGYALEKIEHLLAENPEQSFPVKPGALRLQGNLKGSLPHLFLHLTADSDRGILRLEGNGGYDFSAKTSHFDASLQSEQFDVGTLLQDTLYGLASLQVQAKGAIDASGKINIQGNARIDRFDFNGYAYNHIWANGLYKGDSIQVNVYSDDNNMPLEINVYAITGKTTQNLRLDAKLDCVYLDTLRFLPDDFKHAFLIAQVRAAVNGFDPEQMHATLSIDSLTLMTDHGTFDEPYFRLTYDAAKDHSKQLQVASGLINAQADGTFTYAGLLESLKETFPMLFPAGKAKKKDRFAENLNFRVGMNRVNELAKLLDLPQNLPDSALLIGKFSHDGTDMNLAASAYTRFSEADTLQLSLSLANKANNLAVIFNVDNKSTNYDFDGSLDAEVEFIPKKGSRMPDLNIRLNPAIWVLNETDFNFNPAQIEVREHWYNIRELSLDYADHPDEYIKINGIISNAPEDSLTLDISQFQLSTLFGAVKTDIPLAGIVNGRITAKNLFSTPLILTRNFAVNQIVFDDNAVGNLNVSSGWNSRHNGLALRAMLSRDDRPPSIISGFVLPEKDSVALQANIRDIELQWLQKMTAGSLYGLAGSVGADITVAGKMTDPSVGGIIRFNNARLGINALQTIYSINDSIFIDPKAIEFKKFSILDENKHTLTATGKITHERFSGFNPDIQLSLSDFLVINNAQQTDSLFFGNLRINGLLSVKKNNQDWLISGDITHSDLSKLTVNILSAASTAERYDLVSYINTENEALPEVKIKKDTGKKFTFPLKINTSIWFDPSLTIGAIFNQATGDAAFVTGNGKIQFGYDLKTSAISLLGDYEMASGNVSISLANIAKKTFAVQEGGTLTFHGDPMATTFSLTALYNLRADLKTLDPSFGNTMINTQVPVSCSLTATGSIDKMALEYDLMLPNETDDIQRRVDGLIYTDDMKIKEIASLLAFGSFLPASSSAPILGSPNLMNSLAAITSGGLNKLLEGVLHNNWHIGTNVQTGEKGLSDMGINVSGTMLNNRLTVDGTVGYHNDANQTNNLTGDFTIEYKLVPSGNVVLKFYNATNNQYYEQAATTQGMGVVYKREARTFRKLFDKFRKKK